MFYGESSCLAADVKIIVKPFPKWINFDTPSYRAYNTLTLRKADVGYSMSGLFGGERDYDLIDAIEYGLVRVLHNIETERKTPLEPH